MWLVIQRMMLGGSRFEYRTSSPPIPSRHRTRHFQKHVVVCELLQVHGKDHPTGVLSPRVVFQHPRALVLLSKLLSGCRVQLGRNAFITCTSCIYFTSSLNDEHVALSANADAYQQANLLQILRALLPDLIVHAHAFDELDQVRGHKCIVDQMIL